jgi:hypothetical protein
MQFRLVSQYNRFGTFGLTDDINNPDRNSLFQAVRELIGVLVPGKRTKPFALAAGGAIRANSSCSAQAGPPPAASPFSTMRGFRS